MEPGGIQPLLHSGSDDLESFLAWSEQIKLDMSVTNPLPYHVLGNLAFSKHAIAGQTKAGQASFSEQKSHQHSGEDRAREAKELQIRSEGRQLGCLLVQRTQGETQLRVTKWLAATNGWEAWRQVNLTFLSKLLDSLLRMSFDESPASCLQQLSAWKERVVLYQKLSGEQLPESIMMSVVMSGLTEKARHLLLLHLDGDSSFGDLEHLMATHLAEQELGEDNRVDYQANNSLQQKQEQDKRQLVKGGKGQKGKAKSHALATKEKGGAYKPQPPAYRGKGEPNQLPDSAHRACKGKPEEGKGKTDPTFKGKGQESHPSFKRELEHRGKQGRQNKQRKGKGEAYRPQPQAYKGKGKQQLPTEWCDICWKKGTAPKLAGGTPSTSNNNSNTNNRQDTA